MSETAPDDDLRGQQPATGDQVRLSMRVIEAVADAKGVDPVTLDPLYDVLDPDALDGLFSCDVQGCVQFEYEGRRVTVYSDGEVALADDPVAGQEVDDATAEVAEE